MAGARHVGLVVIGRNEGARLSRCLRSVAGWGERVVYVDSGSTDDSVARACGHGIDTVALDPARPFTAARARNAGLARLAERWPDLALVQFVDGDCELAPGWLDAGMDALAAAPRVGAVFGRRRERFPDATIYNRLCDQEWDGPAGPQDSCAGDVLMRVAAFRDGEGYRDDLIAGEEADLCHRIRAHGWTILRIDAEMTRHDAAMTRAAQWWQRNRRSGHARAQAWQRRGRDDPRLLRPVVSNLWWALPVAWPLWPWLWWRVFRRTDALFATHIVLGKLPHCAGQIGFWWSRARARTTRLIEYK
ncbi:glycosyltransferase family 2 protein [Sphingomonas corticis]|uniref:Glycosyltransferase family 2 protein n=1 Tax=Sphingomonas corticis TaxID=2722791 RepID=A0ABX1CJ27_9SPHN|nr:glycosyltransferase family A protein [Sphingomonas corticis]NJR77953.1 glycosyltransferase family 2 protein [Sphingomonas corticis]